MFQRWIDVSEQLPPIDKKVLVYGEHGNVTNQVIAHLTPCGWIMDYGVARGSIRYWITIPDPPTIGKKRKE